MADVINAADLFCGGGGTSTGLGNAAREMGRPVNLVAVNHWRIALNTHRENHPWARHLWADLDSLNPREVIKDMPGQRLHILVASPECIFHSNARGGKPIKEQLRASAWCVPRWIESGQPEEVLMENVPEFRKWGPLDKKGMRMKYRAGETYEAYLNAIRSLGYTVEDRIICAADYGDPTTRTRLFIRAKKGNCKIKWPEPTHSETGTDNLEKWIAARDIIDWNLKGQSIFNRKKPLKPATLKRIEAGLRKYGGKNAEPFLVAMYGNSYVREVDKPIPTITAGADKLALVEPFLIKYHGDHAGRDDSARRVHSVDKPIATLDTSNRFGLCEPFIMPIDNGSNGSSGSRSIQKPLPTVIASKERLGLVEPFITIFKGQSKARGINEPLPTLTTQPHLYLCEPFIVKYYGSGIAKSVKETLDTITTADRFGLVEPVQLDILFRMLQPHELAAAMSFKKGYRFTGNKRDVVKQIGNAVPVKTATALCGSLLAA